MSSVPSLAALDHTHLKWDKEWMFHKLPKDNIEIPRHHLPDPEAEAIPGTGKQESFADLERNWLESGVDRISMDVLSAESNPPRFDMGNEQSSSNSTPQASSSSAFSFLSGKGTTTKRSKGVVVISSGAAKVESIEDDEVFKRFQEIPRFLPILRHSIGKKDISPSDSHHRLSSRPLFRMASRFQQHLKLCAKAVASDQNQIVTAIKSVEASTATVLNIFVEKKRVSDNFDVQLQKLDKLYNDLLHAQLMLEEIVPIAETLNELLVPSERLPPLSFSKVLERTPVSTSASSSQQSTPRHVSSGSSLLPRPLTRDKRPHIKPIEEVRVVDRMK